ncbi:MAG: hypothetical protein KAR38_16375, partial [Calditrichia bacterium]|nr:hypothetical protein [Calditrichia bacterium]
KGGQRSLQAINPEISLTGDAFSQYILNKDNFTPTARSGNYFRGVGLHIQSNLDPFSMAKVAVSFDPHGVHFGEAYLTWNNVLPNISLTAGQFRQQFGVVNRWHKHALDQFDFPLALKTLMGPGGLNQTGFSINWLMPALMAHSNSLTVEITNGQNEQLFTGENFSFPVILGRFKNYYDLSTNTYLEFGITGMMGENNFKGYIPDSTGMLIKTIDNSRFTKLGGFDLTLFWEPVNKALYKSFLWRSELYYVDKELANGNNIKAFGGYTYGEYKFAERWQAGLRLDYTQPFTVENDDHYLHQIVPYITYWQSHWVKLRLEYNHLNNEVIDETDKQIRLQIVWAVGPHKHDRY